MVFLFSGPFSSPPLLLLLFSLSLLLVLFPLLLLFWTLIMETVGTTLTAVS
jgi:hypothetical protein